MLAALDGIAQLLNRAVDRNLGDNFSLIPLLILALGVGSIAGIIWVYIMSIILHWMGGKLGGKATIKEVRVAITWSNVPVIWVLPLWIPAILLFGDSLFTTDPFYSNINLLLISGIELVLSFWTFVISVHSLAEVNRLSTWKALLLAIIPSLGVLIMLLVYVIIINF